MKQILKKKLWLIAVLVLGLFLAGCGSSDKKTTAAETTAAFTEETAFSEETETEEADVLTEPAGEESEETEEETEDKTEEETEEETEAAAEETTVNAAYAEELLDEDGYYYSKDDVALYIYQYGKLPSNFITKKEAEKLGWSGGSLEKYAPGMAIGGSHFGNYEGILPDKEGRSYTECDIDTNGASSRGAKRIVFSNDGLIYYTEDHYKTFELLYGEE